jgi:hypothetical protein
MIVHVLPGDSLVETFKTTGIEGETIVCREAFVSGDLDGGTLEDFWETRANLIAVEFGGDPIEYRESVAGEFEKLLDLEPDDEVNLWFEYELFCSVNMWFCLDLLKNIGLKIFRVAPVKTSPDNVWNGFGQHSSGDLVECFHARIQFSQEDVLRGSQLWKAFREGDADTFRDLSTYRSPCFPFLKEICDAASEIETEPAMIVRELRSAGLNDIDTVFPEFKKRAGVYGFGDVQVQRILDHLSS